MANITLPSNPVNGQTVVIGTRLFQYDSTSQRWKSRVFQVLGDTSVTVTNEAPTITASLSEIALDTSGANVSFTYTVSDVDSSVLRVTHSVSGIANSDLATVTHHRANNTVTITAGTEEFSGGQITLTVTDGRNNATDTVDVSASYSSALWQYIDISVKARTSSSPIIYDASGNNHTITISSGTGGVPTANTAQTKFASHSVYFPGGGSRTSGPHLRLPSQFSSFGSDDWTHEFWMYVTALPSTQYGVAGNNNATNFMSEFRLKFRTDGKLDFNAAHSSGSYDLADITSSVALSTQTWHHIAIVRNDANITLYIDGTNRGNAGIGSGAVLGRNGSATPFLIGKDANDMVAFFEQTSDYFSGYIENYQIFQGYAKYTSNFTAPTDEQTQSYQAS